MKVSTASDQRRIGRKTAEARRRQRRRLRPTLLALEDRQLLSTFTVTSTLDDGSAGTLRWAVGQANSTAGADTIDFDASFNTPKTITLLSGSGGQLTLTDTATTTINGPGAGLLSISGNNTSRVFAINSGGSAALSGLTITGGRVNGNGGGVFNDGGTTTLTDCTISGNRANSNRGGNLFNTAGSLSLTNCTVSGSLNNSGGLANFSQGTLTLTDSTVSGNSGRGVYNNSGTLSLTNSTVSGNSNYGVRNTGNGSSVTLTNSTVSGNSNIGVSNNTGTVTLTNSTVSANSNDGVRNNSGTITLNDSTVGGNVRGIRRNGGTVSLGNTIVAANIFEDVLGAFASLGHNLIGRTGSSTGWVGTDLTGTDALPLNAGLAPLGNYGGPTQTMPLLYGSPATDAGSNALIPAGVTTDQRGLPRVVNGTVDIGAVEMQVALAPSFVVNTTADVSDPSDGLTSLREAIASLNGVPNQAISWDPAVFSTPQTITLAGIQLELSNTGGTETIAGPAGGVTISAGSLSRVLQVDPNVTASLSGLTLTGGRGGTADLTNLGATLSLTNCTVAGNLGQAISNYAGTTTLTNCTVSGNGSGIFNASGTVSLGNTIVAANGGDVTGAFVSLGHNLIGATDFSSGWVGTDLTGTEAQPLNALLAPLGSYGGTGRTMALLPGSPAIDAGISGVGVPATDERGLPRVGAVDIGAFESQGFDTSLVDGSSPQTSDIGTAFANPLAVSVTARNPVEPVNGGIITFVPQPAGNGASAIFANSSSSSVVIAGGQAAVIAAPNNLDGSYTVVTSASGSSSVSFSLTNTGPVFAALVVNTTSDSLTPGAGLLSLREAIGFANSTPSGSSTITFDPTVFATTQTITLTGLALELGSTTGTETITGPAAGLTIDGASATRVFQINSGVTALVSGLTIRGGKANGNGGGLANFGTTTLTDCTVTGNDAMVDGRSRFRGGGLYNHAGSTLTLTGCTVSDNHAYTGCGFFNDGTATLTDCTISGNGAFAGGFGPARGGGVFNNGTLALTNCTISGNAVAITGGGLLNAGTATLTGCAVTGNGYIGLENRGSGTLTVTDSIISGNWGGNNWAGGVSNNGTATLTNCTITGNTGGFSAGGVYNGPGWYGGPSILSVTNCTITGNSASTVFGFSYGGGLLNRGNLLLLGNTIVAGNTAQSDGPDVSGAVVSLGNNLIGADNGSSGWVGSDLTGTREQPLNPVLAPLGDYGGATQTMPLLYGSPAIDAGNNALIPAGITTDQAGQPRIFNSIVDIGAYENQVVLVPSFVVDTTSDYSDPGDGKTTLREAIASLNAIPGQTITFDSTVFAESQTITLVGSQLELSGTGGTLSITGPAAGVTISGGALSRVFKVDSGVTASISGLTISGGRSDGNGGGLYSLGMTTLTDCTVSGNTASNGGGGVASYYGTLTLTDCTVSGNTAFNGGGLMISGSNATATLTGCNINGNTAYNNGGGVYVNFYNTATLSDCTVTGNSAGSAGGGIFSRGTATLTDLIFSGNSANSGGGMSNDGMATLNDCTFTGNSANSNGGGLANGGTLTLTGCTVSGNSANSYGGGLSNYHTAILDQCTIGGNSAGNGGGLATGASFNNNNDSSTTTLTDCTISGNSANGSGGGVSNYGATTLTDCTVSDNSANGSGGGVWSRGPQFGVGNDFISTVTLTDCTISGNTASSGGGVGSYGGFGVIFFDEPIVLVHRAAVILNNSTVSGNTASGKGGGVFTYAGGTSTLTNSTVSGNSAADGGGLSAGGFVFYGNQYGTNTLTDCTVSGNSASGTGGGLVNGYLGSTILGNTILAANTAGTSGPDALGAVVSSGNNLIGATDGSSGWVGADLTGTVATPLNPFLAPLGDYGGSTQTMPLLPGSPAIDAGSNALIPAGVTTDQRGLPRIVNSVVDIGAFESSGFTIAVTSGIGQSTGVLTAFPDPLVATVTANNPDEPVAGGLVTFTPPSSGASAILTGNPATIGDDGTASVTATANGIVGSYDVTATASGITTPASFGLTNLQLILTLTSSSSSSLSLSGNASINTAGIVHVNSSSSSALTASGNANVTAAAIDVHGGFVRSGNASLNPTPFTGAPVLPVASLPSPGTDGMTNYGALSLGGNSSRTIQPGIYTKISVSGNARLTMAPGIYIIEGGGFTASGNASVTGSGVMIVNAGRNYPGTGGTYSGIALGGTATFNLSPATSGAYAGIVIFQPSDNPKIMTVTTNASGITGTIYAPTTALSESGNGALGTSLIVSSLKISGSGSVNGPSQAGPAIAVRNSNAVAAATSATIGAVSVLDQAAPITIPVKLKVKLTDAVGKNVNSSNLPAVSMAAAVSAGTLVTESTPEATQPDGLFTFDPTSGTSRFSLKSKGGRAGLAGLSGGR